MPATHLVLWALVGAPAESPPVELSMKWTAPAGCPGKDELGRDVEALTGRPLVDGDHVKVDGEIGVAPDGYRLRLAIETPSGSETRELTAADCQMLARAAALIVSVAVDPVGTGATLERPATRVADEPEPPSPASPPIDAVPSEPRPVETRPAPREPSPVQPRASSRHRFGLGASGGVGWGFSPAVTGGIEAEIGWLWRRVRVGASGYHWFARTAGVEQGVAVTAATSGSALRGCYALPAGPVEFPLCGGLDLAALHGGGTGGRVSKRSAADLLVGASVGAGVDWVVRPRFVWRTRIDAVFSMRRPGFHLGEDGQPREVYRAPIVGIRLVMGPQLRWP